MADHGYRSREAQLLLPFHLRRDPGEPRGQGLRGADTRAGGDDPPRPRREGPRRAVPHGHGEDRRLRHPDRREGGGDARAACRRSCWRPRASWRSRWRRRSRSSDKGRGVKVQSVYGGDSMERQIEGIRAGAHVIAGTPGRVLDHLRRGHARLLGRPLPGARRSRPHARHGLRGRDGPDHGVRPRRAADHALLGHRADRDQGPDLPLHGRARVGAALRGPDLRQGGRARLLHGLAAAQGGDALPPARVREPDLLDDLLQHARGDAAGGRRSCATGASRWRCSPPTCRRRSASR